MAKIRKPNAKHGSATITGISLGTTILSFDTSNFIALNLDDCSITAQAHVIATQTNKNNSANFKVSNIFTKKNGTIIGSAVQNVELLQTSGILNLLTATLSSSGNNIELKVANINALFSFNVDAFLDIFVGDFNSPYVDNLFIFP